MKLKMVCPFCGDENCVIQVDPGYHCTTCEYDFTDDDIRHEELRQKISCVCSGNYATEDHPIDCTKGSMLTIGDDEAMGLSELDKPQVTGIFHDPEGIVWITMYGDPNPKEIDNLTTSDLAKILDWLGDSGFC